MSKDLSVFVDESGDFGSYSKHSPYYILSFVFHDQSNDISNQLLHLKKDKIYLGYNENHAIHSYPLIRNEDEYKDVDIKIRKKLFNSLMAFIRHSKLDVKTFTFDKSKLSPKELEKAIHDAVYNFLLLNSEYFSSFDNLIFYYDKGQKPINKILHLLQYELFYNDEIRIVRPSKYTLFQVADLSCTLQLLQNKLPFLTNSELYFFHNVRILRKNYLKYFDQLKID